MMRYLIPHLMLLFVKLIDVVKGIQLETFTVVFLIKEYTFHVLILFELLQHRNGFTIF